MRLAVRTEAIAVLANGICSTRRLYCRSALQVRDDGEPLGLATLEHVVPQAWFDRRAASALCMQIGNDADDPRNLALACARCNHHKDTGHDACGPLRRACTRNRRSLARDAPQPLAGSDGSASALTSAADSGRHAPFARSPSTRSPIATRTSRRTPSPYAASKRRICRLRPS